MSRLLRLALSLPLCATLLSGCGSLSYLVTSPSPGAALLLPCVDPALIVDPATATDTDIALERVKVAQAFVDCKRRHQDLVDWHRAK